MLSVTQLRAIDPPWTLMPPLRVGRIPSGLGTADLFVTISDSEAPLLRVDVYADFGGYPFQNAIVWHERVFLGICEVVYVIDPRTGTASEIRLESYFAAFYFHDEYLLVASGQSLVRISGQGQVLWRNTNLGLDGVVVKSVDGGRIQGAGEWDPPGGWRTFSIQLESGQAT